MSLETIELWHQRARPEPTAEDLNVQLGCHLEEIVEMFDALKFKHFDWSAMQHSLKLLADALKNGSEKVTILDRRELLDALADQIVTAVGVGHCADMNVPAAAGRVDFSNWSKYDTRGQPLFKPNGKIDRGPDYKPPVLDGLF
jgi:hypothetical protein